jgi:hypothetical protein
MTSHPPTASERHRAGNGEAGRRLFRRGPWELAATAVIVLGVVMLMQPLALWLYTISFAVILAGTLMFVLVSHFRD